MSKDENRLQIMAPGLYGRFKRIFSLSDLAELETAWRETVESGGLSEGAVVREEGASFNPRPARICGILDQAGVSPSIELYCAAMYSCCSQIPEHQVSQAKVIAAEAMRALENKLTDLSLIPAPSRYIYLALILDFLRHLKMTPKSHGDRLRVAGPLPTARDAADSPETRLLALIEKSHSRL